MREANKAVEQAPDVQQPRVVFYAPRSRSPQETSEIKGEIAFEAPAVRKPAAGAIHAADYKPTLGSPGTPTTAEEPKGVLAKGRKLLKEAESLISKGYQQVETDVVVKYGVSAAVTAPVFGFVEGVATAPVNIARTAITEPYQLFNIVEGAFGAGAQFVEQATTGDVRGAAKIAGETAASVAIADTAIKTTVKGVKAVDATIPDATFRKALNAPKDTTYQFYTQRYNIEGRQGVFVPPEYEGLGIKSASAPVERTVKIETGSGPVEISMVEPETLARAAPELQTQLYPKKVDTLKSSMFGPEEYKPRSIQEIAQENPELARKLLQEQGQTTFEEGIKPPRPRQLTPEEVIRANLGPKEVQTTLSIKELPANADIRGVAVITDKGVLAQLLRSKKGQVAIPTAILEQGVEGLRRFKFDYGKKFKRVSELGKEALKEIKTPEGKTYYFSPNLRVTQPEVAGVQGKYIAGVKLDAPQDTIPAAAIKRKAVQATSAETGYKTSPAESQIPATSTTQIQAQATDQAQATQSILEQTTQPTPQTRRPQPPRELSTKQSFENPEIFFPITPGRTEKTRIAPGRVEVQVRRKGVFKSFGFAATPEKAQAKAEQIVRGTPAASYRLLEEEGEILEEFATSKDFTRSKKEKGVIVQKREKRISSPGEKAGITFAPRRPKGQKRKSIFGR